LALIGLALLLFVTRGPDALSSSGAPTQSQEAKSDPPSTIDWGRPLVDQVTVPSIAAAATKADFPIVAPSGSGAPSEVVTDSPAEHVVLIYDNKLGGRYWVIEHKSEIDTGVLKEWVDVCSPENGCKGKWTMVDLDGGRQGVLIVGPEGTSTGVIFIDGGMYYDVMGPPDTFSPTMAVATANDVVSQLAQGS
jgi:hypothetical protein